MRVPVAVPDNRFSRAFVAVTLAAVLNHVGDRLLGVNIEVFTGGIGYFSPAWVVDVFFLPAFAGLALGLLYGKGSKWLCYLPPLLVRAINYYEVAEITGVPQGAALIPLGWWGFFVILVMEAAFIGAILGEVLVKKTYGRREHHLVYKDKSTPDQPAPDTKHPGA